MPQRFRFAYAALGYILAGSLACTGSSNGTSKPPESACAAHRDHVAGLYRAELSNERSAPTDGKDPGADKDSLASLEASVGDNTEMVLADCRRDPVRFAPCLQAAVSVPQMERDCLIALDDEGTVEGRAFNPPASGQ